MNEIVYYSQFGAIGDGVTDDYAAIKAAHEYANANGCKVCADSGKIYRIGVVTDPIIVKTSTDWCGATIVFDDTVIRWDDKLRQAWIFRVRSDKPENATAVAVPEGFTVSKGQTNIGMTFDKPCMLKILNNNEKIYLRYGPNENNGVPTHEMILVDEQGNVDPSTPVQYDYSAVTGIFRYSIDDEPLTIGNGTVKTVAPNPREQDPDYDNNYCYYFRGILIERSNTTLYNVNYRVENEDLTIPIDRNGDGVIDIYHEDKSYGVPYHGTLNFQHCYNVRFVDSLVQGHQAYSFWQGEKLNIRNEMGSYSINATYCIGLTFVNLTQYENKETNEVITNRQMYHGIMGTNFCRNFSVDNCYLDRFDSHQGLCNATLTNSTFGFGILVIGGGKLYIENVTRIWGGEFILLRMDYNSVFDGDVVIKNCVAGENMHCIICGNWIRHYNGLPNYITRNVTVDGFVVKSGKMAVYNIRNAIPESVSDDVNPLYLPESVSLSNVYGPDGKTELKVELSESDDAFARI